MSHEFYVRNLFELHSLEGIKLLAGKDSMDLPIENINVMEVPDIYDWSQKEEFLMTTGYSYRNNLDAFLEIIPKLKAKGITALGIKTHRFIDEIPQSMIDCANQYKLPLLELPEQTAFSNVIKEVMEHILLSQKESLEEFLKGLFLGKYHSLQEIDQQAKRFSMHIKKQSPYYILLAKEHEELTNHKRERFIMDFKMMLQGDGDYVNVMQYEESIIVLLPMSDKVESCEEFLSKANYMKTVECLLEKYKITFCLSNQVASLLELRDAYLDVLNLRNTSNTQINHAYYVDWNSLGIYAILSQIECNDTVIYFINKYLKPLIQYDETYNNCLYETLETFLDCDCNMKLTSIKMYVHYNTICYRIKQIKEISGLDLSSLKVLTNVALAMKLKKLYQVEPV